MLQTTTLAAPLWLNEPLDEELQVTYQIALVGSDGVLLGSDRRMFNRGPSTDPASLYVQYDAQSKFIDSDHVVCACSGDQRSARIAREIVAECDPLLSDNAWQSALDKKAEMPELRGHAELLIVRKHRADHAVWMVAGPNGYTARIGEKKCIGANSSAYFLIQKFYKKSPIRLLRNVALLALEYAHLEFSTSVGDGYELRYIFNDQIVKEEYANEDQRVISLRSKFENSINALLEN
jgi:hypothetical protein